MHQEEEIWAQAKAKVEQLFLRCYETDCTVGLGLTEQKWVSEMKLMEYLNLKVLTKVKTNKVKLRT